MFWKIVSSCKLKIQPSSTWCEDDFVIKSKYHHFTFVSDITRIFSLQDGTHFRNMFYLSLVLIIQINIETNYVYKKANFSEVDSDSNWRKISWPLTGDGRSWHFLSILSLFRKANTWDMHNLIRRMGDLHITHH